MKRGSEPRSCLSFLRNEKPLSKIFLKTERPQVSNPSKLLKKPEAKKAFLRGIEILCDFFRAVRMNTLGGRSSRYTNDKDRGTGTDDTYPEYFQIPRPRYRELVTKGGSLGLGRGRVVRCSNGRA
jgi:hypothetical protein